MTVLLVSDLGSLIGPAWERFREETGVWGRPDQGREFGIPAVCTKIGW